MEQHSGSECHRYYAEVIEQLKLVHSKDEINILLLGETGVGKSTFINGLANYLTHPTLAEAQRSDILALIPASFAVTSEDFDDQKVVTIGSHRNEQTKDPGQSATQQCKSFVFPFGERLVRLVDTPGVGDTRGVDQDRLNFEDILGYIGQYNVIHCICILLKPNNARLTITFEYCVKQLLSHLQKSASHNIVFVFTNTRSTFYKPGDTAPALRQVLERVKKSPPYVDIEFTKDTTFCLDNEAFRFLVALKNGVEFSTAEFTNYAQSWDHSATQCRRLMQYIIGVDGGRPGLRPHRVRDTQSVNEARRLITLLAQPLADIAHNIDENLHLMEDRKRELVDIGDNIKRLEGKLLIPYYDLEIIQLRLPETVCSADQCCTKYNVGGTVRSIFKKCHSPCDIYGVQRNVLGDSRLKKCDIFKRWHFLNTCKKCGCSYKKHLHIYYETRIIERYIDDEKMEQLLDVETDAQEVAKKVIEETNQYIEELRYEMSFIVDSMAKFAQFLQHNAIAPYNDTFKCYLDVLIEKSGTDRNYSIESMARMKKLQADYDHAKLMLSIANKEHHAQIMAVEQVFQCIAQLHDLKHYGKKIREMSESQESARVGEISQGDREVRFEPEYKLPEPVLEEETDEEPELEEEDETSVDGEQAERSPTVKQLTKVFEN